MPISAVGPEKPTPKKILAIIATSIKNGKIYFSPQVFPTKSMHFPDLV